MKKKVVLMAAFFLEVSLLGMLPEAKEWELIKNKNATEKVTLVNANKNLPRIPDVDPEPESGCCAILVCICRQFSYHDPQTAFRFPYYRQQEN